MNDFWRMGGYALYVWSSYGAAAVLLLWGVVQPLLKHRQILREIKWQRQRQNGGLPR